MMNQAIIALGSNIEPEKNITLAKKYIHLTFEYIRESDFVQTSPYGYKDQDDYMNGSILIQTDLSQQDCKDQLIQIEDKMGRVKSPIKCGPRSIDLDLVVWNNEVIHDDFYERSYLNQAILELLPNVSYYQEKIAC